ncbi:hypothetical protein AB0F04_26440, partial [Streptomyces sp. NPDC029041]
PRAGQPRVPWRITGPWRPGHSPTRQGVGATAQMPAVPRDDDRQGFGSPSDFGAPQQADPFGPGANTSQGQGQFVRPDVFGTPGGRHDSSSASDQYPAPQSYDNGSTGQYPAPRQDNGSQYPAPRQDNGSTGQYAAPRQDNGNQYPAPRQDNGSTGQYPAPRQDNGSGRPTLPGQADFGAPRPPAPQARPVRQEPEALPPAPGPGDGRTPLYDTLETNWFHGQQEQQQPQNNGSAPAAPQQSQQPQGPTGPQRSAPAGWRTSPNDDLVRQAERVRQPAAGGVTTSGLPRRVPRANLVPGTAQQQTHQSGPQVSRAPDDVRGRLTNLRRGIAQGRQAGSTQTGSHPRPTHQQER